MFEPGTSGRFTQEEISALAGEVITRIEEDESLSERLTSVLLKTAAQSPNLSNAMMDILESKFPHSVLNGERIKAGMEEGYILIDPYDPKRVKTSSYDISMGEYFWTANVNHPGSKVFNPYNPDHTKNLWKGPFRALTGRQHLTEGPFSEYLYEEDFTGLELDDPVVILRPGETILAHTQEFIGGVDRVTTMMKARSSMGRIFLSVCKDAGWGDVGYFNRWTMEIQNNLEDYWTLVAVGQPIAQMVFFRVNPISMGHYYQGGNYQTSGDLEVLKKTWRPENMLPNLKRV